MAEKRKAAEKTERKDEREMKGKERELLYGTADRFGIYQLKDDPALSGLHKGTWTLKQAGILKEDAEAVVVRPENYDLIYTGDLKKLLAKSYGVDTTEEKLHAIFEEFNIYKPADYTGRPLSVSDIVVLHESGENTAHYVDSTDRLHRNAAFYQRIGGQDGQRTGSGAGMAENGPGPVGGQAGVVEKNIRGVQDTVGKGRKEPSGKEAGKRSVAVKIKNGNRAVWMQGGISAHKGRTG